MNILFTVCGRVGSKGLCNKNIKEFLGQPLPFYTLSAIDLFVKKHKSEYKEITVAINTDSKELVKIIKMTDLEFTYVPRKERLRSDTASKIDVIRDTFKVCKTINNIEYDIVVDLDLTSPLRTLEDIEHAIDLMKLEKQCDVVFSVTNSRRNPYFNMVKKEADNSYGCVIQSNYTARQQAPEIYDMNASIYVYSNSFMEVEEKAIFDGKILITHMMDTAVLDIDSEEDFELMQIVAEYFYNKYVNYRAIKTNINKIF